jgi:flagellar hook-associated protein 1 FlgK
VLLSEAQGLRERLASYETYLTSLDREINQRLEGEVAEVNAIARGIADLNSAIETATARTGQPPNDLLDKRDKLIDQLATKVSVSVVMQDGMVANVFIGTGQPLVLGAQAAELAMMQDEFDATRMNIGVKSAVALTDVTGFMTGGSIGGLIDFRREQLGPAHNALGRIAAGLADIVNEQHHKGMDLNGNPGGVFFSVGDTQVLDSRYNTGSGVVNVVRTDIGGLTDKDYVLENTAGGWVLRDAPTGASVPMTGSGTSADPFVADGLAIAVSGAAAVGDRFMLRPTRGVVHGFNVEITDPKAVAAASRIRTSASPSNTSDAKISAGTVINGNDPFLEDEVVIRFTSSTTYTLNGMGSYTFTGAPIQHNGWQVEISGAPAAGDEFTVSSNVGGVGDNRNALALASALQSQKLDGGTASLSAAVGRFVGAIGVVTRQAQVNRDAQQLVFEEASTMRDSISGVNLDEEAANLIRYQQAYQAAAQVIRVADTLFQTVLEATRR